VSRVCFSVWGRQWTCGRCTSWLCYVSRGIQRLSFNQCHLWACNDGRGAVVMLGTHLSTHSAPSNELSNTSWSRECVCGEGGCTQTRSVTTNCVARQGKSCLFGGGAVALRNMGAGCQQSVIGLSLCKEHG
jgi:hypothetical protein